MPKVLNIKNEFYQIRNDKSNGKVVVDMFIWDEIDEFWGINKNDIRNQLLQSEPDEINLHVSGLGGDVNNALAIKQILKGHKATINAWLTGFVASAHTLVIQSANKVYMSDDAFILIHNVEGVSIGNKDAHRQQADTQELVDNVLINGYMKFTGKTREEIIDQMTAGDSGEWLNAEEAREFGLVHDVVEEVRFAAKINFNKNSFSNHNLPLPKNFAVMANKNIKNFFNTKIQSLVNKGQTRRSIVNKLSEELGVEKSEVEEILSGDSAMNKEDGQVFADVLKFRVSELKNLKNSTVDPGEDDEEDEADKKVVATFKNLFKDFAGNIGTQIKNALKNKKDESGNAIEVNIDFGDAVEAATEKFTNEVKGKTTKKVDLNNEAIEELNERLDAIEDENKELKKQLKNSKIRGAGGRTLGGKQPFNHDDDEENEDMEMSARNESSLTKQLTAHFNGD